MVESEAASGSVLAVLRARSGLSGEQSVAVRHAQSTIGSEASNDVVLDGKGVAARHAQLRLRGGVWSFVDFASPSGSVVDGQTVRGEALLAPGSSLRIGEVEFVFAPQDRWEDSPPERRSEDRAPMLLLPPDDRSFWPTAGLVLVVLGIFAAAYFLLRNS